MEYSLRMHRCGYDDLLFAASGLPIHAGYTLSATNHSYGYASCLQGRPDHGCSSPAIRNLMKNAGQA